LRCRAGGDVAGCLAKVFLEEQGRLFEALEDPRVFARFLCLEPKPVELVDAARMEDVARALAVFSDLTNPMFRGHSTGVAALAERAALEFGLGADEIRTVRVAALLHDVGRVSVPNAIWARQGPLDWGAWERVRLHPYYTGRVLGPIDTLGEIADVAVAAHERMDGSGYPQRRSARSLSPAARVLAAAHSAFAMSEERPHRRALTSDAIARELLADATAGRLEARAVDAVLASLGLRERASPRSLHGLSEREFEVSQLLAQGRSDKEIAAKLHISPRTVQVHVSRILEKLGVRTRARAAVWLIEHDLAS
jgi:HD-GYP domain-containing protein (c-di-GMP phosphodiesterase class II)